MPGKGQVLSPSVAQTYYDRLGKKQDSQGFYENPAIDELIAHASFQDSRSVFEFGCGTGKFAARLLENHLSPSASYLGCDISPVMIGLSKHRIGSYVERAQVVLSDSLVQFPLPDHSVDHVISNYVLDLLLEADIRCFFVEAHRTLMPGGKVCLANLTRGVNILSRIISSLWMSLFRLNPAIVGGCRPIDLDSSVSFQEWRVVHKRVVTPFGLPSEVFILASRSTPNQVKEGINGKDRLQE